MTKITELIQALRRDAGDYETFKAKPIGPHMPGWDARNKRALEAAEALTDMLAQQGQITTISWEDGSKVECGLEDCPCPTHEEASPPRGTYVTVRLDDPNTELRLTRVSVVPVADIDQGDLR